VDVGAVSKSASRDERLCLKFVAESAFESRTTNRRVLELVFNLLFRQRLAVYLNTRAYPGSAR
jgi:hypothetical protein